MALMGTHADRADPGLLLQIVVSRPWFVTTNRGVKFGQVQLA